MLCLNYEIYEKYFRWKERKNKLKLKIQKFDPEINMRFAVPNSIKLNSITSFDSKFKLIIRINRIEISLNLKIGGEREKRREIK